MVYRLFGSEMLFSLRGFAFLHGVEAAQADRFERVSNYHYGVYAV